MKDTFRRLAAANEQIARDGEYSCATGSIVSIAADLAAARSGTVSMC